MYHVANINASYLLNIIDWPECCPTFWDSYIINNNTYPRATRYCVMFVVFNVHVMRHLDDTLIETIYDKALLICYWN